MKSQHTKDSLAYATFLLAHTSPLSLFSRNVQIKTKQSKKTQQNWLSISASNNQSDVKERKKKKVIKSSNEISPFGFAPFLVSTSLWKIIFNICSCIFCKIKRNWICVSPTHPSIPSFCLCLFQWSQHPLSTRTRFPPPLPHPAIFL